MQLTIAGIHTGIGKTICSAVLCQALGYHYWKPVQAGELNNTDSMFIQRSVTNPNCIIYPERFRFALAASPHQAAAEEGIEVLPEHFVLPGTAASLVVETAGGVMSPLSDSFLNIDLIEQLGLPVVLVSNNYLGSINHTLLTIQALQNRKIELAGLVFSGEAVDATRTFINQYCNVPVLFSIPQFNVPDAGSIADFAATLSLHL